MKKFLAMLKTDFYRAFFSFGFLLGIISTFVAFWFAVPDMMARISSAIAGFHNIYQAGNINWLLIMTATFAYSASFCTDLQTRFTYPLIIRNNTILYTFSRCVATAVSGGLSVAIGALLFIICACIKQPCIMPPAVEIDMEFSWQAFGDLLMAGQAGLFFLSYLYIIFLQAAFWALLGLMISAYQPNKYVAYIVPFILSFMMNQIANVFKLPIWLDPVKLSTVRIYSTPSSTILLMATATFVSCMLVCTILFIYKAKRRISNG